MVEGGILIILRVFNSFLNSSAFFLPLNVRNVSPPLGVSTLQLVLPYQMLWVERNAVHPYLTTTVHSLSCEL
jgi:hypothetical protein